MLYANGNKLVHAKYTHCLRVEEVSASMNTSDAESQDVDWIEFGPTSPYPLGIGIFIGSWLNGRLQPLDRQVVPPFTVTAPPATPLINTRFHVLSLPDDPEKSYIQFSYLGEEAGVGKSDWDDAHQIYYKLCRKSHTPSSGEDADAKTPQTPSPFGGKWEMIAIESVPLARLGGLPQRTELFVYQWPAKLRTMWGFSIGSDGKLYTQYQVLATHSAIDCLQRILTHEYIQSSCLQPTMPVGGLYRWANLGKFERSSNLVNMC